MDRRIPIDVTTPEPSRHARRQVSLEGVLNFCSTTPRPTDRQAADALRLYNVIIEDSRREDISMPLKSLASRRKTTLIAPFFHHLYQECPSISGRENVLFVVLHALFPPPAPHSYESPEQRHPSAILPRAHVWLTRSLTAGDRAYVFERLQTLALELMTGFFAPLKATGGQTPVPNISPLIIPHSQTEVEPDHGTNRRLSNLRGLCLERDDYRCVLLKELDISTQEKWNEESPDNGVVWNDEDSCVTEVAHIIPHCLNGLDKDGSLGDSRQYVWRILNLFDPGVSLSLTGPNIDTSQNAFTLDVTLHRRFGELKWYLEPVPDREHTYTMQIVPRASIPRRHIPENRTITFNASHPTISPPSPRLLAIHRACCRILGLSGAAECVSDILRDAEDLAGRGVLAEDGSSDLALFWRLRAAGMRVAAY